VALAILAGAAFAPQPASATMYCSPKRTADGFVALRAGPSPSAKLIGRMRPGDEVLMGSRQRGHWAEATWWRGTSRVDRGYDAGHAGRGWVNTRLIEEDC
jgi:hypothetical protein